MKTMEERKAMMEEVEEMNKKLAVLTDEETEQVTGGLGLSQVPTDEYKDWP